MTEFNTKKDYTSKRRPTTSQDIFDLGKIPPQSVEVEEAVLGAILLEQDAFQSVADTLKPESFYKDAHSRIFAVCQQLYKDRLPIDMLTVVNGLRKSGELEIVGGAYYVSVLTNKVASSSNIETHAKIIAQNFIKREVIRICSERINEAYDESTDCLDLVSNLETDTKNINSSFGSSKFTTPKELWERICERNILLLKNNGVSGIGTGFPDLDKITGGWQNSNLIIIAGRPKMGKTAIVLEFAKNACVMYGKKGAFFSMEMSELELGYRLVSSETEETLSNLSRVGVDIGRMMDLEGMMERLINSSLFIDDTPALTITDLRTRARKLKQKHGIEFLVVDYLQLMKGNTKGNREQEIADISRGLKQLAKELEIPVLALSQLNRSVEQRGGDKRPQISDLRESGSIEQDADMIIFIHRPEYYNIFEYGEPLECTGSNDARGIAEINIAAYRNGAVGTVYTRFIGSLTKFIPIIKESDYGNALKPSVDFSGDNPFKINIYGNLEENT